VHHFNFSFQVPHTPLLDTSNLLSFEKQEEKTLTSARQQAY